TRSCSSPAGRRRRRRRPGEPRQAPRGAKDRLLGGTVESSREAEDSLSREMQQILFENEQLKQQASGSANASADPETDREDELLLQTEALGAQPVRIIEFARDFQQRLSHAPRHVAVRAMTTLGEVAAGQPAAFVGSVRLK